MSSAVGSNPFSKTSGFTQPADQVKSVSGYYGNIDFDQESNRVDFRKTKGNDLSINNPYLDREVNVSNFSDISKRIIEASRCHAAGLGLRGLRVFLKVVDRQNDGLIVPEDFKYGLKAFGVDITVEEMNALLKYFDQTRCGRISLTDMLHAMRSNSLSALREKTVEAAYNKLDRRGNQSVTVADIIDNYDFIPNPEYQNGRKTGEQLRQEF